MLVLFWYALLYVLYSFAIILTKKRELVTLLLLSFGCLKCYCKCPVALPHVAVGWSVFFVIVVLPDHTHLFL